MWKKTNAQIHSNSEEDDNRLSLKDLFACAFAQYLILAPIVFGAILILFVMLLIVSIIIR